MLCIEKKKKEGKWCQKKKKRKKKKKKEKKRKRKKKKKKGARGFQILVVSDFWVLVCDLDAISIAVWSFVIRSLV